MTLTIILSAITLLLLLVIIALLFSLKSKSNNSNDLRKEISIMLMQTREELLTNIGAKISENSNTQQTQIANLTQLNEQKLENTRKNMEEKLELIRATVENRLQLMQKDNADKLEKMRVTVDEKLQGTLEQRLGESFKVVNDRLESVYKGLGEMNPEDMRATSLSEENQELIRLEYPENLDMFNEAMTSSSMRFDLLKEMGIVHYEDDWCR